MPKVPKGFKQLIIKTDTNQFYRVRLLDGLVIRKRLSEKLIQQALDKKIASLDKIPNRLALTRYTNDNFEFDEENIRAEFLDVATSVYEI